jgi:glyoxylase-like metal-dependent hydrolase (beta-lactamase superfamily II)
MWKAASGIAAIWLFLTLPVSAQQQEPGAWKPEWAKTEIKIEKVSNKVYLLQGQGGNIGAYVGDEGIALVDAGYAQLGPKVESVLKTISDQPVKYVLDTHWHVDHQNGNAYFEKTAIIIAQDNVRKLMKTGGRTYYGYHPPTPAAALPVITFSDQLTLHMNGGEIHAVHFPHGHTNTDSIYLFTQENVVHMGDDFESLPEFPLWDPDGEGSLRGYIAAYEYVLAHTREDVKIIPGHGNLATRDELAKSLAALKESAAVVQAGIDQGKSLDQLKQERVLAKWSYLGRGAYSTDRYLEILYNDLIHTQ